MDTLFTGGPILTMRGDEPEYVEALGVTGGAISFVGTASEAEASATPDTDRIDLQGAALLPGFIDAHGHIVVAAHQIEQAWLRGEGVTDIAGIIDALRRQMEVNDVRPGDWVVGAGWHSALLAEGRPPTADELDQVTTEHPVLAIHASGHQASMNHKALEVAGYGPGVENPPGGVIARVEGTDVPNGYVEESPLFYVRTLVPPLAPEKYVPLLSRAIAQWTSYGFTTAQEACLGIAPDDVALVQAAVESGAVSIDLLCFAEPHNLESVRQALGQERVGTYVGGVRLGGVKLFLDGSLGGATAWTTTPYVGMEDAEFPTGVARMSDDEAVALLDEFYPSEMQVQCHQNGDAAIDQFLTAVGAAVATHGLLDKRPVAIHCQLVRPEQWASMNELGIVPSIYTTTIAEQGDITAALIGDRVDEHNAAGTATAAGVTWTAHNDAPLVLPDAMAMVGPAVTRTTASGAVLAPEVATTPYEALRAITVHAAYQCFEEDSKGTLEPGKLADLVVLDADPLAVESTAITSITVLRTYKRGVQVHPVD
jgi:predicted amidohydrolase YtcJ